MFPLFSKKQSEEKSSPEIRIEHDPKTGVVKFTTDEVADTRGMIDMITELGDENQFPIFKGSIENAYEAKFLEYTDHCPLCETPTEQMYSNFVWANQVAARVATAPAGHFCPNCPTVIINDDLIQMIIDKSRFQYWGVSAIQTGYSENNTPNLFKNINGKKTTYILDENGGLGGTVNSLYQPREQSYTSLGGSSYSKPSVQAQKKKEKSKKKNKQAKQSRKANRK